MHDESPLLPALRRSLAPPPGGATRLARALTADAPRTPRFAPGLAAATVLVLGIVAAWPLRVTLEAREHRERLAGELGAAVADAGRRVPEARFEGMAVQPLASRVEGVRIYQLQALDAHRAAR